MQSGGLSTLIKSANSLFSENKPGSVKTISIIIDPEVLLISNGKELEIHPIIQQWITSKTNDLDLNVKLFLLAKKIEHKKEEVNICIPTQHWEILHPLDLNFLNNFASENANSFIGKKLWDTDIKKVVVDPKNTPYPFKFSDDTKPPKASILLITKTDEHAYDNLNITLHKMDTSSRPILTKPLNTQLEPNQLEVYSDFDGTLFDCNKFLILYKLYQTLLIEEAQNGKKSPLFLELYFLMSPDSPLITVNENTIKFLEKLKDHPTTLITQRSYSSNPLPCNDTIRIVNHINSNYYLKIKADMESFLDANSQMRTLKQNTFLSKIDQLYKRIVLRDPNDSTSLPKEILLIDDDLCEISACSLLQPYFEKIGIKINTALVMQPLNFSKENMELLKQKSKPLYDQILNLLNNEMDQLNQAYDQVKEATINRGINLTEDYIQPCSDFLQAYVSQFRAG